MLTPPSLHPSHRNGTTRYARPKPAHIRKPWLHTNFGPRSYRRPPPLSWPRRIALMFLLVALPISALVSLAALAVGLFIFVRALGELVRHLLGGF